MCICILVYIYVCLCVYQVGILKKEFIKAPIDLGWKVIIYVSNFSLISLLYILIRLGNFFLKMKIHQTLSKFWMIYNLQFPHNEKEFEDF